MLEELHDIQDRFGPFYRALLGDVAVSSFRSVRRQWVLLAVSIVFIVLLRYPAVCLQSDDRRLQPCIIILVHIQYIVVSDSLAQRGKRATPQLIAMWKRWKNIPTLSVQGFK